MNRILRNILLSAICAVYVIPPANAQTERVTMSAGEITVRRAITDVEKQTGKKIAFSEHFDLARTVRFDPVETTLSGAMKIIAGDNFSYAYDGRHVLLYSKSHEKSDAPVIRFITGLIRDEESGEPLRGALVEIITGNGNMSARTDNMGYFNVDNIPAGKYIAKITPADGGLPQYSEVAATTTKTRATITYKKYNAETASANTGIIADATPITETNPVTTYYYYEKAGDNLKANPRSSMTLIPDGAVYTDYKPKAAIKTNFLLWATTTPNIGLEFSLARKWTLDLTYAYNPWHWDDGRSYRFWYVQPEVRYWFCNRFERHFVGLHGIYGQFNMGKFDWPFPDTFKDHRYKGYGYGAGLAYGYHLPIAKRWAMEFTVGAGWIHLEYDKFRCGACDEREGRKSTDYFGPTKAGINLIFFIK